MAEREEILVAVDAAATESESLFAALDALTSAYRCIEASVDALATAPLVAEQFGTVVLAPAETCGGVQDLVSAISRRSALAGLPLVLFGPRALHARAAALETSGPLFRLGPESPRQFLASVISAAHQSYADRADLMRELDSRSSAIGLIVSGKFRLQTIKEAEHLTTMLALASPDSKLTALLLLELLVNAIEHGNLGIGFEEKGALLEAGTWTEAVEARLNDSAYAGRSVTVTFERESDHVRFVIEDEGQGFDWRPFVNQECAGFSMNGRGIALASGMEGAQLTYEGRGNIAVLTLDL